MINASIDGDNVVYKKDINLGIAVALDNGLIVPVVKSAGEKNLLGLSRAIQDVADRARAKKLNPEEVQGGTFTITNPGNFGAQFGLPIINQPQVAILGVGTIEKRAGGDRRRDRHPADGLPDARLRPPAGRRRGGRSVHGRREEGHRELRSRRRCRAAGRTDARRSQSGGSASCPTPRGSTLQRALVEDRKAGRIPDTLLLLQHPHVAHDRREEGRPRRTSSRRRTRLAALGVEVFETGRGGDVTYHGPGQLVGYPIIDLNPDRRDVHRYVRDLEEVMIRVCADYGARRPAASRA